MEQSRACRFWARGCWAAALVSVSAGFSAWAVDLPDPVIWWDMEAVSNGKVADKSGNGHDLTLGAGVEVVDSDIGGKALRFDGTTAAWGRFSCPAVTNTTIMFWCHRAAADSSLPNASGAEQNTIPYILGTGYSGFGINYPRNQAGMAFIDQANSPQSNFNDCVAPSRETWHHVAITVARTGTDATSGFEILECVSYLDGAFQKTITWTNNRAMRTGLQQNVYVGNSGGPGTRPYSGLLADIRFYDETLTAGQVVAAAGEGMATRARLLLRWPFDEMTANGDGTFSTPEATGNGAAMTLGANMALTDDGVDGKALRFRGTTGLGGKATTVGHPIFEHTVTCWVRRSSEAPTYDAARDNPYPRLYDGLNAAGGVGGGGYAIFSDLADNGRGFYAMPVGCGTTAKTHTLHGLADIDTWSHLAVVNRIVGEGADAGKGIVDVYVNGEPAASYNIHQTFDLRPVGARKAFFVGNSEKSFANARYFCGDLDDFRIYGGALSSNEVRRVYRGLASIDAGADFTVTGERATLAGTVAANAAGGWRPHGGGYAGEIAWTLVSAPAGGEGATIEQPAAAVTRATLPVVGAYVFRLTISDLGVSASDEVTVTRVAADAGNAAPAVTLAAAASATRPDAATLSAAVSDDGKPAPAALRVFWTKKSGPGGVWFEPPHAAETKAYFTAAGSYVLTCTADDGQATTSADVTVTVADETDGAHLSDGLLHYWSLDGHANPHFLDPVQPVTGFTVPDYNKLKYLPGKLGYGARAYAHAGTGAYFDTGATSDEEGDPAYASVGNPPPVNDYLTISAWVYIDPADTNNICGATVVGQGWTFGLRYSEKFTPTSEVNAGGFTLYQQGRSGSTTSGGIYYGMAHYPVPSPSPVGRWLHVCGILARNETNLSKWEMWYDGVKQTATATFGGSRGRVNGSHVLIGGMDYTASMASIGDYNANWSKDGTTANFYSRTFPGIVDEVRMWKRKLTPGEIRYLAANPVIAPNRAPAIDNFASDKMTVATRKAKAVATAVFDDGEPTGGELTYEWSVLSGDAAAASFGDATARETTFTATTVGTYVLQLAVSDGERTSCSAPLTVEVVAAGTIVVIK